LSVNKGNSVLAFTFYGKSDETDASKLNNYPTIIWLNGGPGSSSQFGNLNELGPLWVVRSIIGSGLQIKRNT
jgi:carboxypeptidase C (cathepsin A)